MHLCQTQALHVVLVVGRCLLLVPLRPRSRNGDLSAAELQARLRSIDPGQVILCIECQIVVLDLVRQRLSYVAGKDRRAFVKDVKAISQAPTRELAQTQVLLLAEHWGERYLSHVDFFASSHWNAVSGTGSGCRSSTVCSALERAADAQKRVPTIKSLHLRGERYPVVIRSWETNWEDLATMSGYPPDSRRLISTTNTIEGDNRQLRKVTKPKGAFSTADAARTLVYVAKSDSVAKWTAPVHTWTTILNQLAIRFAGRVPMEQIGRHHVHQLLDRLSRSRIRCIRSS
jgi:transposase-like protein